MNILDDDYDEQTTSCIVSLQRTHLFSEKLQIGFLSEGHREIYHDWINTITNNNDDKVFFKERISTINSLLTSVYENETLEDISFNQFDTPSVFDIKHRILGGLFLSGSQNDLVKHLKDNLDNIEQRLYLYEYYFTNDEMKNNRVTYIVNMLMLRDSKQDIKSSTKVKANNIATALTNIHEATLSRLKIHWISSVRYFISFWKSETSEFTTDEKLRSLYLSKKFGIKFS